MKTVLRLYHSHLVCLALGLMIGSLGLVPAGAIQPASPSQLSADSLQIAVLRYFKIKKGSFPEVYRLSTEGIWPYYERAGARIVGMWQGIYPDLPGQTRRASAEFDEAYLLTRYTSIEHWRATRDEEIWKFGGQGADLEKMRDSLKRRAALTIESSITVLQGRPAANGPYFHVPTSK